MRNRAVGLLILVLLVVSAGGAATAAQSNIPAYVIATHYPEFGGTEPAPRVEVEAAYTVYSNRENDYRAIDQASADAYVAALQAETGLENIVLLNDWAQAQENSAALQIVNNVPVEGALYTIFLPPGWNREAALPVVLSGNGAGTSNNARLYPNDTIPARIALLGQRDGRGGLIVAVSNAGGTESQGIDEVTYRSVGAFFDFIAENGGDKYTAVTAGGSRGGGTALMWAINPLGLDYEVVAVFAAVPPTHYGTLSQVSILTYPAMASIGTTVAQDINAWRYDNDGLRPGLNPSPFMETLIGTGVPEEADAISPIGLAEGLRGKQIVLAAGAHDAFFPLAPFLEFDRALTGLDIRHTTIVTLAQGHEGSDFFINMLSLYLAGLAVGAPPQVPDGRFFFIDTDPRVNHEVSLAEFFAGHDIDASARELPVIAQFPYRAGVGNPVDVQVCGTPGDAVELVLHGEDGAAVYVLAAALDADECVTEQTAFDLPPGDYAWTLTVNGEAINPRNTPTRDADGCGFLAVTTIMAEQPTPQASFAFNDELSFGLDEFSGMAAGCTE